MDEIEFYRYHKILNYFPLNDFFYICVCVCIYTGGEDAIMQEVQDLDIQDDDDSPDE